MQQTPQEPPSPSSPVFPSLVSGGGPSSEGRWKRVAGDLERSLLFLQRQHAETLALLHQEVERLKRENKELNYRLIMYPVLQKTTGFPLLGKPLPKGGVKSPPRGWKEDPKEDTIPELPPVGKWIPVSQTPRGSLALVEEGEEDEGADGRPRIYVGLSESDAGSKEYSRKEAGTNTEETMFPVVAAPAPEEPKETPNKEPTTSSASQREAVPGPSAAAPSSASSPAAPPPPPSSQSRTSTNGGASSAAAPPSELRIPAASSNPFLANVLPSSLRKPPTLEECEAVIRQLWNINHMQMQELMYLRSCLEEIHRTHRIPEDYMLAGPLGSNQGTRFPRVKNASKQWMLTPLPAAERAILPALKQTLGNAFAERQKRAQAAQRKRLHRTAL